MRAAKAAAVNAAAIDPPAHRDSIVALSSGPGRAAVAVVRVSGPRSGRALAVLSGGLPEARVATLRELRDPRSGALLDRALVLWFPGPRSFSGEDLAEFHLHGGRAVVAGVLEALCWIDGLRLAEPGEFTRRAFGAGRLDLAEVEGLADLINAETAAQRRQALAQLDGGLSARATAWRDRASGALARLEALIDFAPELGADEAVPGEIEGSARRTIRDLAAEIAGLLDDGGRGERLRDGLQVAIVGPPNAGKSSLLNYLAGRDAAIVADHPGTTRDVVEVRLDLAGWPVTVADTAGLRAPEPRNGRSGGAGPAAAVEEEGIRRSRLRAAGADLVCALFDLGDWPGFGTETAALLRPGDLVLFNKLDRAGDAWSMEELPRRAGEVAGPLATAIRGQRAHLVSVKTGAGLDRAVRALEQRAMTALAGGAGGGDALITRARHRRALADAVAAFGDAGKEPEIELAAEALRAGVRALGRVTGQVDVEDLLDRVFGEFCIGK